MGASVEKIILIAKGGSLTSISIVKIEISKIDEEFIEGKENGFFDNYESYKKFVLEREGEPYEKMGANWLFFTQKEWELVNQAILSNK